MLFMKKDVFIPHIVTLDENYAQNIYDTSF